MNDVPAAAALPVQREHVVGALYEAAELEHNLMCTYLYAAFSLRDGVAEGLTAEEAAAVGRWRQLLLSVAIEEMGHLAAVWNITSALGASPRVGRGNFPLDPGYLPACVVVKLAPFNADTLQHFVFLERPHGSTEPDGAGFTYERSYVRGVGGARLTPLGVDYDTVGTFYGAVGRGLRALVERYGEADTFDGDPGLQLSPREVELPGAKPVICLKTALAAFDAIVAQGEGAPRDSVGSHYQKFLSIRSELAALTEKNPGFAPAFPAATNPVLRRPPRPEGRVWLENPDAVAAVDVGNASYGLMLRLPAYAYAVRGPSAEKSLVVDLAIGLMQAIAPLAERAARLPAGRPTRIAMRVCPSWHCGTRPPCRRAVPRAACSSSVSRSSPMERGSCVRVATGARSPPPMRSRRSPPARPASSICRHRTPRQRRPTRPRRAVHRHPPPRRWLLSRATAWRS